MSLKRESPGERSFGGPTGLTGGSGPIPTTKGREDRGAARAARRGDPPSASILDAAFRRAYRATPRGADRQDRSRRRAQLKIIRSCAVVLRHLRLARSPFARPGPTEFARRLVEQRFGSGALDRSLRRVGRAEERIRGLSRDEQLALRRTLTADEFAAAVRRTYGRLASFVREVDADLVRLREVRHFLDGRPKLDPATPSIAVAGFPNVGKSSLVARLSSAHPRIADYPFTTTAIAVGHTDLGFDRLQVVDTPGVLGRATRQNPAELEAETAVGHGVDTVVFVLDPSETCGYPLVDQERLLARWRSEFPQLEIIEVETKSDLGRGGPSRLQVSAKTGKGVDELRAKIGAILRRRVASGALPPMEEPTVELESTAELPEDSSGRATRRSRRG